MTHRLSEYQFYDNVDAFRGLAKKQGWDTPGGAFKECGNASQAFNEACQGIGGIKGMPHIGTHTTSYMFRNFIGDEGRSQYRLVVPSHKWEHEANVVDTDVGLTVVDWTARQFDSDTEFPHIVSLEEFAQTWGESDEGRLWSGN
jgi:hypothetical protein|tara:strand:- start:921 stop:1352 length:432 start_codon:yes stop_codon:yes gene_type:complete